MKLAACIEWLFADETDDVAERVRLAAAAGMAGVEFHLWRNKDLGALQRALDETGLPLTGFVVEPRRSLVAPAEHGEFLDALRETLPQAQRLNCPYLVIASGFTLPDTPRQAQHEAIVTVLGTAAKYAEDAGITLILEPLNDRIDHPGMYLVSVREGLDIIDEVASPALKLIFDAYHSAVMGDDPADVLRGRYDRVAHVQVADNPGRGAPGTGGIDFAALTQTLQQGGYAGAIGLEFKLNGLATREALALSRRALGSH
jgi:hydroxypyruvate isomerase